MRTSIETGDLSLSRLRRELQQMPEVAPSLPDYSSAISDQRSGKIYNATNFDTNVVIIMAALLCVLVCALGINSLLRCALRCTRRMAFESPEELAVRRANTGMKKNAVKAIPTMVYSNAKSGVQNTSECPICLGEFADGENVRVLPNCRHSFHMKCIDTWLVSHSSCPTCRHILLSIPEKKSRAASYEMQHESVGGLRSSSYRIQDSHCHESCTDRISSVAPAADDPPPVLAGEMEGPHHMHVIVEIARGMGTLQP